MQDIPKSSNFAADLANINLITAAMQRQKFDILAGWNIQGSRCLECDTYMPLSGIALTRNPRTKGLELPMSARGWNDRFLLWN